MRQAWYEDLEPLVLQDRVKNAAEYEMAPVFFIEEYLLRAFRGRGLPTPMDSELLKRQGSRPLTVSDPDAGPSCTAAVPSVAPLRPRTLRGGSAGGG